MWPATPIGTEGRKAFKGDILSFDEEPFYTVRRAEGEGRITDTPQQVAFDYGMPTGQTIAAIDWQTDLKGLSLSGEIARNLQNYMYPVGTNEGRRSAQEAWAWWVKFLKDLPGGTPARLRDFPPRARLQRRLRQPARRPALPLGSAGRHHVENSAQRDSGIRLGGRQRRRRSMAGRILQRPAQRRLARFRGLSRARRRRGQCARHRSEPEFRPRLAGAVPDVRDGSAGIRLRHRSQQQRPAGLSRKRRPARLSVPPGPVGDAMCSATSIGWAGWAAPSRWVITIIGKSPIRAGPKSRTCATPTTSRCRNGARLT